MVHFGSLVESQEKFKCIEIMTQESFDFRLKLLKSKVRIPNCPANGAAKPWAELETAKVLNMALYHFRSERNIQHLTMEEKFIASNVPKPTLLRHIRQLEMFLKIKVSTYALGIGLRTRKC